MSRKVKPRPDNKLTERYRSQIGKTKLKKNLFIEHQTSIGENVIIVDNFINKGFVLDYMEKSLYSDEGTRWTPNIQYVMQNHGLCQSGDMY